MVEPHCLYPDPDPSEQVHETHSRALSYLSTGAPTEFDAAYQSADDALSVFNNDLKLGQKGYTALVVASEYPLPAGVVEDWPAADISVGAIVDQLYARILRGAVRKALNDDPDDELGFNESQPGPFAPLPSPADRLESLSDESGERQVCKLSDDVSLSVLLNDIEYLNRRVGLEDREPVPPERYHRHEMRRGSHRISDVIRSLHFHSVKVCINKNAL